MTTTPDQRHPRALVIPAAGLGTRMRSVSADLPKEMLPLAGRPVIEYAVEEGIDAGIETIVVVIREGKEILREHLAARYPQVVFVVQAEQRGEMDAIALARKHAGGGGVAVLHPDNIYLPAPGALRRLVAASVEHGDDISGLLRMDTESAALVGNSGHVELAPLAEDLFVIERILPKGSGRFALRQPGELRSCGIRCLGPHLFDHIERIRPHILAGQELTDGPVLDSMMTEHRMLGLVLPGRLYDVGNPDGYSRCRHQLEGEETG